MALFTQNGPRSLIQSRQPSAPPTQSQLPTITAAAIPVSWATMKGARSAARLGGGVVRRVTPSPLALWPGTFTLSVLGHLHACADEALE